MKAVRTTARLNADENAVAGLDMRQQELYRLIPAGVEHVPHPSFQLPETEEQLFNAAAAIHVPQWTDFPAVQEDVRPAAKRRAYLKKSEEVRLFLQYNFARCRLAELVAAQKRRKSKTRARQMVHWYERVMAIRSDIVNANMALVLAMAKRTRIPNVEFAELISEGNMALLRSIEKFDVSRGFKFSTYACRAILKSFNRLAGKTGRYRAHFPAEFDPEMERSDYDVMKHEMQQEYSVEALRDILHRNRAELTEVEQTIVRERFALPDGGKRRTLNEVGRIVGLTNERVRQLQSGALKKLRVVLDKEYLTV